MNGYESLVKNLINSSKSSFHFNKDQKLQYISQYLHHFYNDHLEIPSIVVAGTKGKGSTCSVIESILRHSGLKTGLFTSPHLETPRERIKINGVSISGDEYISSYHNLTSKLNSSGFKQPPFFGLHTLMSIDVFKKHNIDIAVIECGVGGRFDWTKIYSPLTSVITHLEYDHVETLGRTAQSIAWHKAGIFVKNIPALTAPQNKPFMDELVRCAQIEGIDLKVVYPYWNEKMGLHGPTAKENSSLAIEAAKTVAKKIGISHLKGIAKGVENAKIFGRYQELENNGIKWLLDGAHTKESILSCQQWYDSLSRNPSNDCLIISTTKERDPNTMLKPLLAKGFKNIFFIKKGHKDLTISPHILASTPEDAIKQALATNPKGILVTGSLHLVGRTLRDIGFPTP